MEQLSKRVGSYHIEQHRKHVYLEEATHDALQLHADRAQSKRNRLVSELVPAKFVVALDGTRNKRRKIQRVEKVSAKTNVPPPGIISCLDQQVQHAKENVGKTQREIRTAQKGAIRQESVLLQPYVEDKHQQNTPDHRLGPTALENDPSAVAQQHERHQGYTCNRVISQEA